MGGTTRRQFLARGGALAGALAMGGTAAALVPAGGRAEATALTAARRRTYAALMEAVVVQPSVRLDPAVAPEAAAQFAATYAGWPAERRRDADAVLDALERSTGLSTLDRRARGEEVRARARPSSARPGAAERERLDLSVRALELAAVVLAPSDDGHQIVTVS